MLFIVSSRICNKAGLDSLASKKDEELIELNKEISFDEVVVDKFFKWGEIFAIVRKNVGYNVVKFPLLVAIRL